MQKNNRKYLLVLLDIAVLCAIFLIGIGLITICGMSHLTVGGYAVCFGIFAVLIFASRLALGVYSNLWRYANYATFSRVIFADAIGGLVAIVITRFIYCARMRFWECVSFVAVSCIATLLSRFAYRMRCDKLHRDENKQSDKIGVAIVGAGQIGNLLAQELTLNTSSSYIPMCFIDNDLNKIGGKLLGLDVFSEDEALSRLSRLPIKEIILAIPDRDPDKMRALREKYTTAGYKVKLYDFPLKDDAEPRRVVREININDLLFRNSISVFNEETRNYYSGKTILVTGGGGSIGSELCRWISGCSPKKIIVFDIYENNAYDIQQELIRKYGDRLDLTVEIGSVRDRKRLEAVFRAYKPDVVIHAAAHKHVPLMEHSNCEAVKNNVFGTYNTADMAEKYAVKKFILISTDKAVNPTNVMGATKRLCEMVIQCRKDSETAFCAVRFGNVLGSNGSVIPLFRRQIEAGGPVTITDKRIIRYFMTIPEATGLVMQAGAMAKCGELFVLDMGKPVRILDLAENMIKLSGFTPYKDIDIQEIGLRPGEKLYEELLIKTEHLTKTKNDLIFIERDTPHTREEMETVLDTLRRAVEDAEMEIADQSITLAIKRVVPTFLDSHEVNATAEDKDEMKQVAVHT